MRNKSVWLKEECKLVAIREVKVVICLEKARNPYAGSEGWWERLSDVRYFNGGIFERSESRSPWK
jgi:hypothetical protein